MCSNIENKYCNNSNICNISDPGAAVEYKCGLAFTSSFQVQPKQWQQFISNYNVGQCPT